MAPSDRQGASESAFAIFKSPRSLGTARTKKVLRFQFTLQERLSGGILGLVLVASCITILGFVCVLAADPNFHQLAWVITLAVVVLVAAYGAFAALNLIVTHVKGKPLLTVNETGLEHAWLGSIPWNVITDIRLESYENERVSRTYELCAKVDGPAYAKGLGLARRIRFAFRAMNGEQWKWLLPLIRMTSETRPYSLDGQTMPPAPMGAVSTIVCRLRP